jgi:hypothetical protein
MGLCSVHNSNARH